MNPEVRIAKTVSYLFHPFLMPTYGMLLYFLMVEPFLMSRIIPEARWILCGITFVFTFLLPVMSLLLLYRAKLLSSFHLQSNYERRWPFLITAMCYLGMYYMIPQEHEFIVLRALILGATMAIILALIVNLYTKVSAHMVGIGGIMGAFTGLSYKLQIPFESVILLSVAVAGLIGFSRLRLQAHTPAQVYLGFFIGAITELLLFIFMA